VEAVEAEEAVEEDIATEKVVQKPPPTLLSDFQR